MKLTSARDKVCIACGQEKPIRDFVTNKTGRDGHENRCKECQKKTRKEYYLSHRNEELARCRSYQEQHREEISVKRRAWARKNAQRLGLIVRKWKENNKERLAFLNRQYRTKNKPGAKAQYVLNHAIRAGKIQRPTKCQKCESGEKIEGHHCDYSKPLEVIWLCQKCHNELNRKYA